MHLAEAKGGYFARGGVTTYDGSRTFLTRFCEFAYWNKKRKRGERLSATLYRDRLKVAIEGVLLGHDALQKK